MAQVADAQQLGRGGGDGLQVWPLGVQLSTKGRQLLYVSPRAPKLAQGNDDDSGGPHDFQFGRGRKATAE